MDGRRTLTFAAMIKWIKRIEESPLSVESDAGDLIYRFGDQAYYVARDRAQRHSVIIDANRPRRSKYIASEGGARPEFCRLPAG